MKITVTTLLLCLCCIFSASAQTNYSVKGTVSDSSSNVKLLNATVAVLNAKDSTLRSFTRATANGTFNINKLAKGKFILLVTYPEYADYVEHFALDSVKTTHDFNKVYLNLKSRILKEVMIKGTAAAMKIKGDTTEFDPRAFVIQPNSKVEDLLKQLPGIQVDKDGKITAQGKTVPKVLVDGEEFFGDDPTLVTKNIRGDMVDKIQLYDKKSDQAAFTGIDNGKEVKTINIKLKEDKKNGYFGKLEGAMGTDKFYSGQALFNKFWGKKKFSFYGIGSNTGKTGLGWDDNSKYGGNSGMEMMEDGGIMFFGGGGDGDLDSFDGRYNGQGIPTARTGGMHFDTKWGEGDKKTLNTNYKLGYMDIKGTSNNQNQNTLPGGNVLKGASDQNFIKSVFRQKLDFMYQVKIDTNTTLKFMMDGTAKNSENNDRYNSMSATGTDTLLNTNARTLTNDVDDQIFNASALLTKKLKKKGRTISWNVNGNLNNSDAKGFLNSQVNYYNRITGAVDSVNNIDQYKKNVTRANSINSNATYTEPISKTVSLSLNYGFSLNHNNSNRQSFNASAPTNYNLLDSVFSNNYTLNQTTNSGGATINYRAKNSTLNVSARAANVNFNQKNEYNGMTVKRSFINWNPSASYQYRFTQQRSFRLSYWGNTSQPSIDQIQPIRVNSDPLNISLGNPNLGPSFRSNFNMFYNSYKILSDQSIWINGGVGFVNNDIVSSTTTDSTGRSTYLATNLSGHTPINYNFNADMGRKIKFGGLGIRLSLSTSGSKNYNYINGLLNTTTTSSYNASLNLYKYKQKKYDVNLSAGPGYSFGKASLQPNINNNGNTFNADGNVNVYLPLKFQLGADGRYEHRGKTQAFNESFNRTIVNAGVTKTFLKGDNLKMALTVNDLLNQNRGFDRSAFNGNITQNTYTTIRRYFLFTVTWDFSRMGGGVAATK
ncbi:outer membrane beta-barrel family protein [Mucilaginibacter myungsuensis]|uniref:TonB-dependent receptor n=1 Tax=Mucilaginibacter myungsuensis TaxID=649104 RepID=A0A929KUU7_9SPHI|nr:outer membrane beta-barrel family protein [Mucilaginibacter myungsuensis]MBE9661991.1 TonB-dependent receptor [Mucilaginibacter myungsuensis]MDN3599576.1 outer membrane beta-barrel family protein [Mucilaginibacter myungsuensis]